MFIITKESPKWARKWEKRREKKWLYVFFYALVLGIATGGLSALFIDLIVNPIYSWFIYVLLILTNGIGGAFMGLSSYKLNEIKYKEIQDWMKKEK